MAAGQQDPFERGKAFALKLLAHRARTEVEICHRLERAGFAAEVAQAVVARLKELRFLDDEAYARSRAQTLLARGRFGPAAVAERLSAAGVAQAAAVAAIREACGPRDERALARECLAARRPALAPTAGPAERARAARFLLARGFCEAVAREIAGLEAGGQGSD